MEIYLKRPVGKRKCFSIYLKKRDESGRLRVETLEIPEIRLINQSLKRGITSIEIAEKNAKEILERVKKKHGLEEKPTVHNHDNQKILEKFWESEYIHRTLVDPDTAKYELNRSISYLGNLSLVTADIKQILKEINSKPWKNTKKRRVLGKIQLLLKFIGRNEKLPKPPKEQASVKYLSEDEFLVYLTKVEDRALYCLYYTLFYTGTRLGEALGLSELKLRPQNESITIDVQLDKKRNLRLPKNRKKRKTYVQLKAFKTIREWIKLKEFFPYSRSIVNKRFKIAFGRHLTPHDLRHSYAINLLSKGVPIAHVAQSIGDSVKVCEEYYTGYELIDESLETIKKIMSKV